MTEVAHETGRTFRKVAGPLLMPFSNVFHLPFPQKVAAAQLAGFGALSMHPTEVRTAMATGLSLADMRAMASDSGVVVDRLDPLSAWNPHWLPDNMDETYVATHDISPRDFFELCNGLGCASASLNATFPTGRLSFDQVVDYYGQTCDLAAEHNVLCDIENIPMWGVASLADAWDIVRAAARPNGGLVFDTLHYVRSGSTPDTLRSIPGDQIHCVQINDGPLQLPAGVSLIENCFDRQWPGEGEFPLIEILSILAGTGGLNQINPEVFSPANRGRSAEEIACLSSTTLRAVLQQAHIES